MSKYGGSRYKVLKAYKEENLKWDTVVWTFYWQDLVTLEKGSLNFEASNDLIYGGHDEPQFMLAEAAAHVMCDKEFKYAVLEWYEGQEYYNPYKAKWHDFGTIDDFSVDLETEKFIGKDGKNYVKPKTAWQPKQHTSHVHWAPEIDEKTAKLLMGNHIEKYTNGGLVSDAKTVPSGQGASAYVHELPGMKEHVKHPKPKDADDIPDCDWINDQVQITQSIRDTIIHLNDIHKWTREEIADWLETLDVDLRFKTPEQRAEKNKRKELDEAQAMMVDYEKQIKSTAAALKALKANAEKCSDKIKKLQEALNVQD